MGYPNIHLAMEQVFQSGSSLLPVELMLVGIYSSLDSPQQDLAILSSNVAAQNRTLINDDYSG